MSDPKRFSGARPADFQPGLGKSGTHPLDITQSSGLLGPDVSVFSVDAWEGGGVASYLQIFFAKASAVTLGTTAPDYVIPLAANGIVRRDFPNGLGKAGSTGLSMACTTTATGSTAGTADVSVSTF